MKKLFLNLFIIFFSIIIYQSNAEAHSFKDLPNNEETHKAIEALIKAGAIQDGSYYYPTQNATRAEFSKVLVEALGLFEKHGNNTYFTDVAPNSKTNDYITTLYKRGVINGFGDGTFRPNALITREQMAKMLTLAIGLPKVQEHNVTFNDIKNEQTLSYVHSLKFFDITNQYPDYYPNNHVTREQLALFIHRTVEAKNRLTKANSAPVPEVPTIEGFFGFYELSNNETATVKFNVAYPRTLWAFPIKEGKVGVNSKNTNNLMGYQINVDKNLNTKVQLVDRLAPEYRVQKDLISIIDKKRIINWDNELALFTMGDITLYPLKSHYQKAINVDIEALKNEKLTFYDDANQPLITMQLVTNYFESQKRNDENIVIRYLVHSVGDIWVSSTELIAPPGSYTDSRYASVNALEYMYGQYEQEKLWTTNLSWAYDAYIQSVCGTYLLLCPDILKLKPLNNLAKNVQVIDYYHERSDKTIKALKYTKAGKYLFQRKMVISDPDEYTHIISLFSPKELSHYNIPNHPSKRMLDNNPNVLFYSEISYTIYSKGTELFY